MALYGRQHRRVREVWAKRVALGNVACVRCGDLIHPSEPWDLGHVDGTAREYAGAEHRYCNRAAGARLARRRRRRRSRPW